MDRPYVVCHMLASVDGKIDGDYMSIPECSEALKEYENLRGYYECQATLYGTTTIKGGYCVGLVPELSESRITDTREDYIGSFQGKNFIISLDPKGELGWESPDIEKKNRPKAHVIEALTAQATDGYIAYLRKIGISYVFAGDTEIDCALLLRKLKNLFGIEVLMIAGGGYTNWSFLQAGCIDELSLVIAPIADGNTTSVSIFERAGFLPKHGPIALTLKAGEQMEDGSVWLRYVKKNGKKESEDE